LVHKTDSDETFHSVKLHRMIGWNVLESGDFMTKLSKI
jgi:hypothetical protein